jgi:hypothetical protein
MRLNKSQREGEAENGRLVLEDTVDRFYNEPLGNMSRSLHVTQQRAISESHSNRHSNDCPRRRVPGFREQQLTATA